MPLPSPLKSMNPLHQAMLIHGSECEIAEADAWARAPISASDRVKIRAKITQQKKRLWQAKHGR
ncbi:MAG: hypothetical protein WCO00_02785 [Rhodospirillaceae bacterium]